MNKDKPEYGDIWLDGYGRRIFVGDVYDLKKQWLCGMYNNRFFPTKSIKNNDYKI